jgi:hypothetical protein
MSCESGLVALTKAEPIGVRTRHGFIPSAQAESEENQAVLALLQTKNRTLVFCDIYGAVKFRHAGLRIHDALNVMTRCHAVRAQITRHF